ncbi:uncharacterized protein LOC129947481 [Eupeodes corollae]|uniref:uncharacterized protein LOC129947481 n=1 Tax=Eupeodes corollae TaxID=290404 RepID=UPI002492085A|nr:uncharacterized protein LOC129947481 [Eupeodes corollae]XP_055914032.1 uncharacterized protein LOC129947481 [Eupeodes corollae]XP_055914033.1 uncharacterized protein LOC129947481 [Eupeodes corollae]
MMSKQSNHTVLHYLKIITVLGCVVLVLNNSVSIFQSSLYLKEEIQTVNRSILDVRTNSSTPTEDATLPPAGYLVWNKHCRIPDIDPFTRDAMKIFHKKKYSSCSEELPLTKMQYDMNLRSYIIHIDETAKFKLIDKNIRGSINCCYQSILRSGSGNRVDKDFKLKDCVAFESGDVIPDDVEGLIITCKDDKKKKNIQQDAFYLVREKQDVRQRLETYQNGSFPNRPASVLMLGIDSMSKFNLRRVMPETTDRLIKDGWFELKGYNKVDDNTYPNLMAFLTGYNQPNANSKCKPKTINGLSNCTMIWNLFRDNGYVTSYAEDETWMSTFNFNKIGFSKSPVDYYLRPFMLAIEKTLRTKKQSGMSFCVGQRHSAEYIFDLAIDLATRYKSEPYFGLFWTNTFSHNSFSDPSSMDTRVKKYIDELKENGILDESIVVLLSDHGMRFGPLRSLRQGFLEERLPFIFIWLPYWFRAKYPHFAKALEANKHRLTNAYDLHMTLKHILELTGRTGKLPQAEDCPNCQSLFYPVPAERACQDIAIDEHWCTCIPFEDVNKNDKIVLGAISAVLDNLNTYLMEGKFFPRCTKLKLKSVDIARKRYDFDNSLSNSEGPALDHYRVRFTVPQGKFEASVSYSKTLKTYEIIDSVSRLDAYKETSECIEDGDAKKYCICDKKSEPNKTISNTNK